MADPRDELVYADLANEPGLLPPREPLRIRVSPYDTPPPSDTGWGGFGAGGRPTGRLFEPDMEPAPPPETKPAFQPGLLSLGNVVRGIGSLVQGAGQPAAPPAATAPPFVAPPRGRSTAPFDPMVGVRPDSYPKTAQPTFGENLATGVGHAATEVLQEPYNMVRAGQDIAAPGATEQQVQQAREQEAAAVTNLTSNMIGTSAPFARSATLGTGFAGPLWHGSPKNDLTVLNESTRGPLGPGVHTSPAEQISKGYYAGPEGTVYKLPEKTRDIYLGHGHRTDQEWFGFKNDKERLLKAAEPDKKDELSKILDKMWSSDGYPTYQRVRQLYGGDEKAQELFKKAGFGGISGLIDGPEVLLFGPQSLRASELLKGKPGGPWEGGIRAYHSSPHDFDKFDWSKLRTGEGANTYGAGFYAAENPAVSGQGGQYWRQFVGKFPTSEQDAALALESSKFDRKAAIEAVRRNLENGQLRGLPSSNLNAMQRQLDVLTSGAPVGPRTYEVNINARPELLLDWDKPLKQQPVAETVRGLVPRDLRGAFDANVESGITGANAYYSYIPGERFSTRETRNAPYAASNATTYEEALRAAGNDPGKVLKIKDPTFVSQTMAEAGIPGIRYLDQGSRITNTDARNMINLYGSREAALAEARTYAGPRGPGPYWQKIIEQLETPPSYNYVVTDPSKLDILAKYGIVGTAGAGGIGSLVDPSRYRETQ